MQHSGAELRDAGLERATNGSAVTLQTLWAERAAYAILQLALADANFTAEDVRRATGPPPTTNAIGSAFRTASTSSRWSGWTRRRR